jgi:hypothetical protein
VFAFGDEVFSKAYNYLLSDDAFSEMTEEEEGLYIIPLDMSSHSYSFSKYVYEQLLPLCVGVSFFFIAFLLACIFFQTSSAVYCLFVFLSPPKHYCTYTETSPCYRCSHEKCRAGTFAEMSVSI